MENKKKNINPLKIVLKILGLFLITTGVIISIYIFFPLIYWQIFFASSFSNKTLIAPIPKSNIITGQSIQNLFLSLYNNADYQDANTWFPGVKIEKHNKSDLKFYTISIPKLQIKNALVSTSDTDLSKHLVNFNNTTYPPKKGNAIILGHSSLPQLYNPKNYKTIFTNLYKLKPGDKIIINYDTKIYVYTVNSIILVDPKDTKSLEQDYKNSFLTLITCAPPGTVWKRLIVRATIEKYD